MPRAYATFVQGDGDVVIYDEKLERISAKTVIVSQPATESYDKKKKRHVLDLGRMTIKADGRTYECLDFKKFVSEGERVAWLGQEKDRLSAPLPPPDLEAMP